MGNARWHHSDLDGDGNTEYGPGVTFPNPYVPGTNVQLDYTTESPGQDAVAAGVGAGLGAAALTALGVSNPIGWGIMGGAALGLGASWAYDHFFGDD